MACSGSSSRFEMKFRFKSISHLRLFRDLVSFLAFSCRLGRLRPHRFGNGKVLLNGPYANIL